MVLPPVIFAASACPGRAEVSTEPEEDDGMTTVPVIPPLAATDKMLDEMSSAAVTGHMVVVSAMVSVVRTVFTPFGRLVREAVKLLTGQFVTVGAQLKIVWVDVVRTVSVVSCSPLAEAAVLTPPLGWVMVTDRLESVRPALESAVNNTDELLSVVGAVAGKGTVVGTGPRPVWVVLLLETGDGSEVEFLDVVGKATFDEFEVVGLVEIVTTALLLLDVAEENWLKLVFFWDMDENSIPREVVGRLW